ncbi:MAG: hypothetical protein QNJ45_02860 [Ardenticatenaceae bacterium]|nr:hypothetical protein [Ardenticatenaceae bacterium]
MFAALLIGSLLLLITVWGDNPNKMYEYKLAKTRKDHHKSNHFVFPKTKQQLSQLLWSQGIDLTLWGKGAAKSVHNLWQELQTGDSRIQVYPLRRQVEVSSVIIRSGNHILIELEQTMNDNRVRQRHWPPSEKIQRNENPRHAAVRCLCEELGLSSDQFEISTAEPIIGVEERKSASYPGLTSFYKFYLFEATIQDLPATPFQTDEVLNDRSDPIKTHLWSWKHPPRLIKRFLSQSS